MLKLHPKDLLEQAQYLSELNKTRPKQVHLRQAVSSAYYALFHLLTQGSIKLLIPDSPSGLCQNMVRRFNHGGMKQVCTEVAKRGCTNMPGFKGVALAGNSPCQEISQTADAFVQLQEMRHKADYDLSDLLDKSKTLRAIKLAQQASKDWKQATTSNKDQATIFAAALLFGGKER
jgi:uncharacterized protein (UPF0332 family)